MFWYSNRQKKYLLRRKISVYQPPLHFKLYILFSLLGIHPSTLWKLTIFTYRLKLNTAVPQNGRWNRPTGFLCLLKKMECHFFSLPLACSFLPCYIPAGVSSFSSKKALDGAPFLWEWQSWIPKGHAALPGKTLDTKTWRVSLFFNIIVPTPCSNISLFIVFQVFKPELDPSLGDPLVAAGKWVMTSKIHGQ